MEKELEKNAVDSTDPVEEKARDLEKKGADIQDARKAASGDEDKKKAG